MSSRALTPSREKEIRALDPAEHPEVAELLALIDGQRKVIRGKDDKIERQRAQIRKGYEKNDELRAQIAELKAEIESLRGQST